MIPEESKCVNGWLHNFKISEDHAEEGVFETCRLCGKRQFFRVVDRKADNATYLKYHIRQALPPNHLLFYREYFYEREELRNFIYD